MAAAASLGSAFLPTVHRLNRASVTKRYEAHRDVDWDAPGAEVRPDDPRFCLPATHPLGGSAWYRALPEERRSALGLDWACQTLRVGISFEACLTRGLMEFAASLPNGSPLYRYAMHEVIEESHHSMMFHEFIRRSGCQPHDVSPVERWFQRRVVRMGATFPELFFLCVLSGEVFIDHDNREHLRDGGLSHPTLRRIMQIHVTEEARHVCFASAYLREHLPGAPAWKRRAVRAAAGPILARGEGLMLRPTPALAARHGIPSAVVEEAYGRGSAHSAKMKEVVAPIFELLAETA
jgi:hypothetical protein